MVISPVGTIQEKTILLFRALKVVLPVLGTAALTWIHVPAETRCSLAGQFSKKIRRSRWVLPAILALTILLHVGWIIYYPTKPYADSAWYFEKAGDLARGRGYIYDLTTRKPTAAWPIGYPAFLALFFWITGPRILVAQLVNVGLATLIVYLTYWVAKCMFGYTVAFLSALFMATFPGFVVYSSLVCSDILFAALFIVVLSITLTSMQPGHNAGSRRRVIIIAAGLLNGFLVLTRSTGLMLFPLWIITRWLVEKRNVRATLQWTWMMALGTCLVVALWTFRNYQRFHKFIPVSTNGGVNFWMGNNPLAYGGFIFPRDVAQNPLLPLIGDEVAVDETGYKLGMQFIREHPGRALKLLPAKLFYLFNSSDSGLEWDLRSAVAPNQGGAGVHIHMVINLVYTLLALMALLGLSVLLLKHREGKQLVWIGLLCSVVWTLIHLPFFGQDRFMLPLLPFLMI